MGTQAALYNFFVPSVPWPRPLPFGNGRSYASLISWPGVSDNTQLTISWSAQVSW